MAKTEEKKKWFLKSKGIWITAGAIVLAAVITAIATILVPYIESRISKEDPSPNSPPLQVEAELKAIDSYRGLEKEGDKLALMEGDIFRLWVKANRDVQVLPLFLDSNGNVEVMKNCEGGVFLKEQEDALLPPDIICRLDERPGTEVIIVLAGEEIISQWRDIKETIESEVGEVGLPEKKASESETLRRERGIEYVPAADETANDKLKRLKDIVLNRNPESKLLIIWHL